MAKESHTQRTSFDSLKTYMENKMEGPKKPAKTDLKPDLFAGTSSEDASDWLDLFERISKINNWSSELQLKAFPIYLTGIARTWYLTLADDQKTNWDNLKQVFQDRFTSGPQNWLLSQQLSARKQLSTEPLDKFITDITRLCKCLKLSDEQSTRYFIDGLQRKIMFL